MNAQNRRFRQEIVRIFDALHDAPDVRAVVLTGAGRAFSAGADLKERPGLSEEPGAYPRHNRLVRAAFDCVMECEKPVVRRSTARPSARAASSPFAATSWWRARTPSCP